MTALECASEVCSACCGHGCRSFYNESGTCILSAVYKSGAGWHPRAALTRSCAANTCMSCTENPNGWRDEHVIAPDIVVSGKCLSEAKGTVAWSSPVTLVGRLFGEATIRGPCPLVIATEASSVDGVTFECLSGEAAVDVVGPGVTVSGTAAGAALVRAVNVKGVNVAGLVVTGNTTGGILAVFGHTSGDIAVTCTSAQTVVRQPLDGSASYSALCRPVDIHALMGLFGRRYEVQFYHKDVFADSSNSLLTVLVWTAVVGGGVVLTLHEDVFWKPLEIQS